MRRKDLPRRAGAPRCQMPAGKLRPRGRLTWGGWKRFAKNAKPGDAGLRLSKKLACGDLFRQMLKKCLRLKAQTPRPPGKAGRYELTLEGLRALQTSR